MKRYLVCVLLINGYSQCMNDIAAFCQKLSEEIDAYDQLYDDNKLESFTPYWQKVLMHKEGLILYHKCKIYTHQQSQPAARDQIIQEMIHEHTWQCPACRKPLANKDAYKEHYTANH